MPEQQTKRRRVSIYRRVNEYAVTAVPDSHRDSARYALRVCRDGETWAVLTPLGTEWAILSADGTWTRGVFRAQPTTARWKAHHHDLETALRLAEQVAPDVMVNGVKASEVADA